MERVRSVVAAAYARWVDELGVRPIPLDDDYARRVAEAQVWALGEPAQALIVLKEAAGWLLVDNVAVHPEAQGHGLGRRLLAFAEERARTGGFAEVRLYTNARMHANRELYGRLGYRELATETIAGRHAVWLAKSV